MKLGYAIIMIEDRGFSALGSAFADDPHCAAIFVDADGHIRSWNLAAERIFGHSAREAIGRRADVIVPESLRADHWAGFNRAIGASWSGSPAWGPIEPLHKDGRSLTLDVFLVALRGDPMTRLIGVLALFRSPSAAA